MKKKKSGNNNFLDASKAIYQAVELCVVAGKSTCDIGGSLGTAATGDALVACLQNHSFQS